MQIRELDWVEKCAWLRLIRTPRIGPVAFRDLMARYGSAAEVIHALPDFTRGSSLRLASVAEIDREMEAHVKLGIRLIAACEPDYPTLLRALDPPPPLISVWGDVYILAKPCVALVGSRNASAIGQRFAGKLAAELGEAGVTVVSGFARGIDTAAHHGSIPTGTAAVLGGGVDCIYPRQNAGLFETIKNRGALISESPLGQYPTARDFPRRNRIISGLSLGVVIIESAERSGTLITARYALEQNREVMAAPGSPLDPRSKGCNRLIRQGATLIETADHVLDAVRHHVHRPPPTVDKPDRLMD
ncbi:MAG: DNA-protecting protein DprA, partial [Hyphomonadaceae bacterium]|nr:DNA-protecting protein DprA [Hyphomonadaceae bacterium]